MLVYQRVTIVINDRGYIPTYGDQNDSKCHGCTQLHPQPASDDANNCPVHRLSSVSTRLKPWDQLVSPHVWTFVMLDIILEQQITSGKSLFLSASPTCFWHVVECKWPTPCLPIQPRTMTMAETDLKRRPFFVSSLQGCLLNIYIYIYIVYDIYIYIVYIYIVYIYIYIIYIFMIYIYTHLNMYIYIYTYIWHHYFSDDNDWLSLRFGLSPFRVLLNTPIIKGP